MELDGQMDANETPIPSDAPAMMAQGPCDIFVKPIHLTVEKDPAAGWAVGIPGGACDAYD
jgi:hypothetical protein